MATLAEILPFAGIALLAIGFNFGLHRIEEGKCKW